ncbi:hypothetical protein CR513_22054, partial [Mucuna pruriens]
MGGIPYSCAGVPTLHKQATRIWSEEWCEFHWTHGHTTKDYRTLLIHQDHLGCFIQIKNERPKLNRQKNQNKEVDRDNAPMPPTIAPSTPYSEAALSVERQRQ